MWRSVLTIVMPAKLPSAIKSLVIQQWLQGRPRNDIAAEIGLSSGAVTNMVKEWRNNLGFGLADELRELAVTMKKVGINAIHCALGFRIATIMLKVGVNEDSFESFIVDVYNRCKDIGLSPEDISFYLQDLLEFSRTVLPLSKIPDFIKEKTDDKIELDQEIEKLRWQIKTLQQQKSDAESFRNMALQEQRITGSELKWYSDLRAELRKYLIPVDDISKFAKIVDNIREYGYDAGKVIKEFSDLESLRSTRDTLQQIVQSLENKISDLEQQRSTLEPFVNKHNQALSTYNHLEDIGFNLKELDFMCNTVNEIALENAIPSQQAVKKFLLDVERQYNNKLGFQSKVEVLRDEVNKLSQEQARLRTGLLLQPLVGPKLVKLTQLGVSEQDIINIAALFETYVAGIDRQSFISELNKYGGLKSAIQKLTKESDRMRKEVDSLQTQERDLNENNQRILTSLVHSRHTFDFFHGSISSLRNEILGLVSVAAYIPYLMQLQFEYHQNLESNHVAGRDEFVSLTRACIGEEPVSVQEIKKELIKAIEVMQTKLDVNDKLSENLSNTRLALMNKENN
jgi:cell division protein FtsB